MYYFKERALVINLTFVLNMSKEINFGIGFITGRDNICDIINNYYKYILEQVEELDRKVNFMFFILYDLNYLNSKEEDFHKIDPQVFNQIKVKYLSPEYVLNKKKEVMKKHNLTEQEVNLVIGSGYAKARNCILYEAIEENIDSLLFWDDDEYPLAAIKNKENIKWIKQKNVLQHIKNIENADITYGYRCGLINPLPYVEYNDIITEDIYKKFITAIQNEVISWDKIQKTQEKDELIGYADETIATHLTKNITINNIGDTDFVLGSGICLNLNHLEKIPAFYNPPEARGEDTFFSCALKQTEAKVLQIPVYHFHDAFLKFTFLMKDQFPKELKRISTEDDTISLRFKRTITGWTKYKPLLYYILNRNSYENIINESKANLINSAKQMSLAFPNCDLTGLPKILEEYDNNVEKHYKEYLNTNKIWDKIKYNIQERREIKIG